jgi:hypothetical protein
VIDQKSDGGTATGQVGIGRSPTNIETPFEVAVETAPPATSSQCFNAIAVMGFSGWLKASAVMPTSVQIAFAAHGDQRFFG